MSVTKLPNCVDQKKHKRLKKQAENLQRIQCFPPNRWVDMLVEQWPQSLPDYVISRLIEQGHSQRVQEYIDCITRRDHFQHVDKIAQRLGAALDDAAAAQLYQTLSDNNLEAVTQAAPLLSFMAALPKPTQVTVVTSDVPLMMILLHNGVIAYPQEKTMICETRSRTNQFVMDVSWDAAQQRYLEGALVAGLAHKGGVQIRSPLPLRVQRLNSHGVMEWVNQEKIYGFSLVQGRIVPLSVHDLTQAHCTGPNGEHWPLEAGTHIGNTDKDFGAFQKKQLRCS